MASLSHTKVARAILKSVEAGAPIRVYDVANPHRYGTVIKSGPEVSEVRFDDGPERNIPNVHLVPSDPSMKSWTIQLFMSWTIQLIRRPIRQKSQVIRQGQEAWSRLRSNSTWKDWKKVGAAHVIGRTTAMRDGHINKPKGRSYNAAFSAWQKKFGFQDLDKGDRSRLFDVMDHLKEIDGWLQRLPESEPTTQPSEQRMAEVESGHARAGLEPKPTPMQKLKDELVAVIEERDRYKREYESGGGDLWTPQDQPQDIAKVIVGKLTKSKAEKVARAILKMVRPEGPSRPQGNDGV